MELVREACAGHVGEEQVLKRRKALEVVSSRARQNASSLQGKCKAAERAEGRMETQA
jgi:hypothetical protein